MSDQINSARAAPVLTPDLWAVLAAALAIVAVLGGALPRVTW